MGLFTVESKTVVGTPYSQRVVLIKNNLNTCSELYFNLDFKEMSLEQWLGMFMLMPDPPPPPHIQQISGIWCSTWQMIVNFGISLVSNWVNNTYPLGVTAFDTQGEI